MGGRSNRKTPRLNEHVYALLKTIFATAVEDELLDRNPCRERMRKPMWHIGEPATLVELALLAEAMPERLRVDHELVLKVMAGVFLHPVEVSQRVAEDLRGVTAHSGNRCLSCWSANHMRYDRARKNLDRHPN